MGPGEAVPWAAMLFLGAYHGINPGMGWLFAVALGMQQGSGRAVWRALPPLALGHGLAVAVVLMAAVAAQIVFPSNLLRIAIASTLILLGAYRLWRHRHPRFGGMQVGFRDLTAWSFLMASAHGAGFMLLPFVMHLSSPHVSAQANAHVHHAIVAHPAAGWVAATAAGIHTLSYLLVTASVAWLVFRKFGLALLRTAWFNLDWLWAGALALTGVIVLLM
jgi:hypothetical protein